MIAHGIYSWVPDPVREKMMAIKEILFPSTAPSSTTQPIADATTQPTLRLDELVARQTGRTAAEKVEFIQQTFDAQMAQLDRREREVRDLERQVELAKQQMARDLHLRVREVMALPRCDPVLEAWRELALRQSAPQASPRQRR